MSAGEGLVPPSLRTVIDGAKAALGLSSLADLAVLGDDPYRLDTPANHRDGRWFADRVAEHLPAARRIHLRGFHYVLVSVGAEKPDGTPYRNVNDDWEWLQEKPAKYARWLGYVPFERITDARNDEPTLVEFVPPREPFPTVLPAHVSGLETLADLSLSLGRPFPFAYFEVAQPYRIVVVGEKSSIGDVLAPLCDHWGADLYLPGGHPTDSMVYALARTAAEDGRPLIVLYFSDCDPSGYDMPRVLARKLQAHRDREFPELIPEVVSVALSPEQVREYDLPSTPLKATEQRRVRWRERMGVEQTEIDALASLRPDLLRQISEDAVRPYFDESLNRRVWAAREDWRRRADEVVSAHVDVELTDRLTDRLREARERFDAELAAIKASARAILDDEAIELPEVELPEPDVSEREHPPLLDPRESWAEQTLRLMRHKRFES